MDGGRLGGHAVSSLAPEDGSLLIYNAAQGQWRPYQEGDTVWLDAAKTRGLKFTATDEIITTGTTTFLGTDGGIVLNPSDTDDTYIAALTGTTLDFIVKNHELFVMKYSGGAAYLGFYGATPVVKSGAIADAAGGATVDAEARTALNALLGAMRNLGLLTP